MYCLAYYGFCSVCKCFSEYQWKGTEDWKCNRLNHTLKTSEARQLKANIVHNSNAKIMDRFEKEIWRKKKENARGKRRNQPMSWPKISAVKITETQSPSLQKLDLLEKLVRNNLNLLVKQKNDLN